MSVHCMAYVEKYNQTSLTARGNTPSNIYSRTFTIELLLCTRCCCTISTQKSTQWGKSYLIPLRRTENIILFIPYTYFNIPPLEIYEMEEEKKRGKCKIKERERERRSSKIYRQLLTQRYLIYIMCILKK